MYVQKGRQLGFGPRIVSTNRFRQLSYVALCGGLSGTFKVRIIPALSLFPKTQGKLIWAWGRIPEKGLSHGQTGGVLAVPIHFMAKISADVHLIACFIYPQHRLIPFPLICGIARYKLA